MLVHQRVYVLHHSAEFMIESRLSRCTRHRASIAKLGATAGSEGRYGGGAGLQAGGLVWFHETKLKSESTF